MRNCVKCNKDICDEPPSITICRECYNDELNYRIDNLIPKDIKVYLRWIDFIYLTLFGFVIYLILRSK